MPDLTITVDSDVKTYLDAKYADTIYTDLEGFVQHTVDKLVEASVSKDYKCEIICNKSVSDKITELNA